MNKQTSIKAQMVDPRTLLANPWNTNQCSPEIEKKLDASIRKNGMFKAIIVRELPTGELQIIGGEHRSQSAVRVGLTEVPVSNLGPIDDLQAKEIGVLDNTRYGHDDAGQLAKLLEELGTVEDLAVILPYTDIELADIFGAGSIDLDLLDLLGTAPAGEEEPLEERKPAAAQTHQTMRFRVPVEDVELASAKLEKIMKLQGFDDKDSLTNAGDALIYLLKSVEI